MSHRDVIKSVVATMCVLSAQIENEEFKRTIQGRLEELYLTQLQYYMNQAGELLKEKLRAESAAHGPIGATLAMMPKVDVNAGGNACEHYSPSHPMNLMASYAISEK